MQLKPNKSKQKTWTKVAKIFFKVVILGWKKTIANIRLEMELSNTHVKFTNSWQVPLQLLWAPAISMCIVKFGLAANPIAKAWHQESHCDEAKHDYSLDLLMWLWSLVAFGNKSQFWYTDPSALLKCPFFVVILQSTPYFFGQSKANFRRMEGIIILEE